VKEKREANGSAIALGDYGFRIRDVVEKRQANRFGRCLSRNARVFHTLMVPGSACREDDAETLVALIRELQCMKNSSVYVKATPEAIRLSLFGRHPYAEAIIAERDGAAVGFALFFHTFSTFRAQPSLYLEDIFVRPENRGVGIGKALLAHVARLARSVAAAASSGRSSTGILPPLASTKPSALGRLTEWTVFRLEDAALQNLAAPPVSAAGASHIPSS